MTGDPQQEAAGGSVCKPQLQAPLPVLLRSWTCARVLGAVVP